MLAQQRIHRGPLQLIYLENRSVECEASSNGRDQGAEARNHGISENRSVECEASNSGRDQGVEARNEGIEARNKVDRGDIVEEKNIEVNE